VQRSQTANVLTETEVHENDAAAALAHDVFGLDVAVQQSRRVDGGDGGAQVEADAGRLACGERSLALQEGFQGPPADVLHPDTEAVFAVVGPIDRDHAGMADSREQARFLEAAPGSARPKAAVGAAELQGYLSLQLDVPGAVDLAKLAAAYLFQAFQMSPAGRRRLAGERGTGVVVTGDSRIAGVRVGAVWPRR